MDFYTKQELRTMRDELAITLQKTNHWWAHHYVTRTNLTDKLYCGCSIVPIRAKDLSMLLSRMKEIDARLETM